MQVFSVSCPIQEQEVVKFLNRAVPRSTDRASGSGFHHPCQECSTMPCIALRTGEASHGTHSNAKLAGHAMLSTKLHPHWRRDLSTWRVEDFSGHIHFGHDRVFLTAMQVPVPSNCPQSLECHLEKMCCKVGLDVGGFSLPVLHVASNDRMMQCQGKDKNVRGE